MLANVEERGQRATRQGETGQFHRDLLETPGNRFSSYRYERALLFPRLLTGRQINGDSRGDSDLCNSVSGCLSSRGLGLSFQFQFSFRGASVAINVHESQEAVCPRLVAFYSGRFPNTRKLVAEPRANKAQPCKISGGWSWFNDKDTTVDRNLERKRDESRCFPLSRPLGRGGRARNCLFSAERREDFARFTFYSRYPGP